MNTQDHRMCSSCFFSTKFPGVAIEESGRCNFCNSHDFATARNAQTTSDVAELHHIAEELKNKRRGKYDCIIGASGGLDSSYVIYVAKKVLGLNPLVIKYDHGFNYDIANDNLETICRELKIDFRMIRSAEQYDQKYVKFVVLALRNKGIYWGVCSFCHYILPAVVYKYAVEENISAILGSDNLYQENLHLAQSPKLRFMIRALFKNVWELPKLLFYLAVAQYYLLRLKLEFYVPPISNVFLRSPKSPIEKVNITQYVSWDIDHMVETLKRETGWRAPQQPSLPMRFDCKIEDSFINHTYKTATGITIHGIICNNLIYDGLRTKSELKETVEHYDDVVSQQMEESMARLGLK